MRVRGWFALLCALTLYAANEESNTTVAEPPKSVESNTSLSVTTNEDGIIEVKDTSGLSEEQLREKANAMDTTEETKKVSIEKIVKNIDDNGTVNLAQVQKSWEELSPKAQNYDWVQTKSGEWFKGKIIAMYDEKLEFDSKEIGIYTFKLKDIKQIKSHTKISVNIENLASFEGILRYKNGKVKLIQGDNVYDFDIKDVVSFAPDASHERDLWSGKFTISMDFRSGNIQQYDFTAQGDVKRRTADSVLGFSYLGRISSRDEESTANNHRLNQKYDLYVTRYFFWTPLASEYYADRFKNIAAEITVGAGAGYTLFKEGDDGLSLSGGPAFIYTKFDSVGVNSEIDNYSFALEFRINYQKAITQISDYKFDYKLTYGDEQVGTLKHHMVSTLENELLSWLDLDLTFIWDYIANPQQKDDGTVPQRNDYEVLIGLGIEF